MMTARTDVSGAAALSICESLLLELSERGIVPESGMLGILRDAEAAHKGPWETVGDAEFHAAVAALINRILESGNSVRRR